MRGKSAATSVVSEAASAGSGSGAGDMRCLPPAEPGSEGRKFSSGIRSLAS